MWPTCDRLSPIAPEAKKTMQSHPAMASQVQPLFISLVAICIFLARPSFTQSATLGNFSATFLFPAAWPGQAV